MLSWPTEAVSKYFFPRAAFSTAKSRVRRNGTNWPVMSLADLCVHPETRSAAAITAATTRRPAVCKMESFARTNERLSHQQSTCPDESFRRLATPSLRHKKATSSGSLRGSARRPPRYGDSMFYSDYTFGYELPPP